LTVFRPRKNWTKPRPLRPARSSSSRNLRLRFTTLLRRALLALLALWTAAALAVVALRWLPPPFTAVQVQRRIQALGKPYLRSYAFLPLGSIAPSLQHAVIAAEDARFYQHHGFDWREIRNAVEDNEDGRTRGASTITQQLVKNLFFGTGRSYIRKALEATLVPVAEFALGKQRILELYLNVVEWGPGVYGAEAAARHHYTVSARRLDRAKAIRLAAILPAPLRRRPDRMTKYAAVIDERMRQMGW
jgi:monofunctional glycosyltransferase